MADLKEDRIDFSKLERELENAMKADAKYWRENDAKLRAVDQRVESYEQFRDMVAASHLRPLDKKDRISECKMQQPWNPLAQEGSSSSSEQDTEKTDKPLPFGDLPTNSLEFSRDWKRCKDRYALLKTIGGPGLGKVLKKDLGMGTLGEILRALDRSSGQEDASFLVEILESLPGCGRFDLALDFLDEMDWQALQGIFQQLEAVEGGSDGFAKHLSEVRKVYQVS